MSSSSSSDLDLRLEVDYGWTSGGYYLRRYYDRNTGDTYYVREYEDGKKYLYDANENEIGRHYD